MPEIRCGHCGKSHPSVAEVRACSGGGAATAADGLALDSDSAPEGWNQLFDDPSTSPSDGNAPFAQRATLVDVFESDPAPIGAGPDPLGRSLVVRAGDAIPEPWSAAPVVLIDTTVLASPTALVEQLQPLWNERERFVVQLEDGLSFDSNEASSVPAWRLGPSFSFDIERLHHLVWSNAAELRDGELTSRLAGRAVELGAKPGGKADVVLPDGADAWLDGGPVSPQLLSDQILHLVSLSAGSLETLGSARSTADLADDQVLAVEHAGGAARIIAPAGSGKTRVLTERARHLLRDWRLPVETLTLVAFNKRAQLEILDRTTDLPGLRVRTLNALALSILNGTNGFKIPARRSRVTTITERDVRATLDRLVDFPRRANTDPVAVWIEALTAVRLGLRSPDQVEESYGGDVEGFADLFEMYRQHLLDKSAVDFDEQIFAAIEVLLTDPIARHQAQRANQVLLVDEFQDLTPAHLLFVRLLAGPRADVFGVGDDDQTIYGFTGATPRWLIEYDQFFPGAKSHALEVNYRCAPGVVDAATKLLVFNRERVEKSIRSADGRSAMGDDLRVLVSEDVASELVDTVSDALEAGTSPAEIAILSRVNVTLAVPQVVLAHAGIPVVGAVDAALLDRTGIRSSLAWLRIASDTNAITPSDIGDTVRRPSRGLSRKVLEWMSEHRDLTALERLAGRLSSRDSDKIRGWISDAAGLARRVRNGATTLELLDHIRDTVGLGTALTTLDDSRGNADRSTHTDDLDALRRLAGLQPDPKLFESWLRTALAAPTTPEGKGVLLSTVHRVKGLEWPHVVVLGAEQGTFPHRLAELEEERRVFHVAITRSSISTTVLADKEAPTQFLDELAGRTSSVAPPPTASRESKRPVSSKANAKTSTTDQPFDESVFELLRSWRLDRARADKIAPFIIFHDSVLKAIAARQPTTLGELSGVKGVGAVKLENYGDEILSALT
ncbi:MAG: ATP-dependent DNA helicase UvrD2 [Acidimicrobiales bacterium]